ncbi:hypothetical protein GOP47_0026262 [Adiantum capillus-veneris]|nr:hypothetical protein GOP47_0026262 [Adiantum capillus-veneris]
MAAHLEPNSSDIGPLSDWTSNDDTRPCHWSGVTCSFDGSTVIALNISGMSLSGTLSPAVGRLPNMVSLSLVCTQLSGRLPSQVSHLSLLRYLNISNNAFVGPFPSSFSRLVFLEVLDASDNNFTGALPADVGVLHRLRHLHLGANFFEGTIPPSYGNLVNAEYLNVGDNNLTGRIPMTLGLLRQLRHLYMGYNALRGVIPAELGLLNNLMILDLQSCKLSGAIPFTLSSLSNLDTLFLQNNNLQGPLPPQFGNLSALKSFDLSRNSISGVIPHTLCNLTNLELLSLLYNSMSGAIPACIGNLPKLQVLKLFNNNFSGQIPQNLGLASLQLRQVDLCFNSLTGPIPPSICAGQKLEWLLLMSNQLSGEVPPSLSVCIPLVRIRMGHNQLQGSIPPGLLALPNLDMLELNSNSLQGLALPSIIPSSCKLKSLNLASNRLTGSLPSAIANLSSLEELDLSMNGISGSIPLEIGHLSHHLSSLDLSTNLLTGSLPASIALCSRLSQFNLSRNHLSGPIPSSLQNMTWIMSIDLSYNNFSGNAPTGGPFNESSLHGNAYLLYPVQEAHELVNSNSCAKGQIICTHHPTRVLLVAAGVGVGLGCILFVLLWIFWLRNIDDPCIYLSDIYHVIMESRLVNRFRKARPAIMWRFVKFEKLQFTMQDILQCLEDHNMVGQGGSGAVYRGIMPCGRVIAVKRIPVAVGSGKSWKELDILGKVSHRHIVKLLGWCSNGRSYLLLYDYMPNGSLGQLIDGSSTLVKDTWETRFKIALGAAEALAYLHHDCSPPILHRDVKPNNILMDNRCEAKLADFGLARPLTMPQSFSYIAGTCGYLAPEYGHTLRVNEKSDVYSYGVVLLELVTGRKALSAEYGEGMDIVKWARSMALTEEKILQMLDSSILCHGETLYTWGSARADQIIELEQKPSDRDVASMAPELAVHELPPSTYFDSPSVCSSFSATAAAPAWIKLAIPSSSSSSSSAFTVCARASLDQLGMTLVLQLALRCVADDPHLRPTMHEVVKMLKAY